MSFFTCHCGRPLKLVYASQPKDNLSDVEIGQRHRFYACSEGHRTDTLEISEEELLALRKSAYRGQQITAWAGDLDPIVVFHRANLTLLRVEALQKQGLTLADAARRLGVPRSYLYRLRNDQKHQAQAGLSG